MEDEHGFATLQTEGGLQVDRTGRGLKTNEPAATPALPSAGVTRTGERIAEGMLAVSPTGLFVADRFRIADAMPGKGWSALTSGRGFAGIVETAR